jgi:hypothetical protein
MYLVLSAVFAILYVSMFFAVRKIILFLQMQRDSDDQPVMEQSDGRAKYLIVLVLSIGLGLVFLNWCLIWFGHINYAY